MWNNCSECTGKCDTLKLKCIESAYSKFIGDDIRELNGAVINIDTFPEIITGIAIVNVSNDTFFKQGTYEITSFFYLHVVDTEVVMYAGLTVQHTLIQDFLPDDTLFMYTGMMFGLSNYVTSLEEDYGGITIDKITYIQMFTSITHTSKDGYYSNRVAYAGSDTAIFYLTKNEVGINDLEVEQNVISVFPNPAQTQFTVTNVQNAALRLYNILGQEVLQTYSKEENTVINISNLPQGLYVLKIEKENTVLTRKIQIKK
jgi:hypothetical protein